MKSVKVRLPGGRVHDGLIGPKEGAMIIHPDTGEHLDCLGFSISASPNSLLTVDVTFLVSEVEIADGSVNVHGG